MLNLAKERKTPMITRWHKAKEILRIAYTLPFVLSSVVGVAFALTAQPLTLIAVLIPLDVFLLALFVNFSNDYFDYRSGVDKVRFGEQDKATTEKIAQLFNQKVFWSGNCFEKGLISEGQGRALMLFIASMAVLISIPIVLASGLTAIILGLIALALAFFYTAPPLNLGARGLGEIDVGVSFTLIAFFSFFVLTQQFDLKVLIIAVGIGITMMMVRLCDEAPGYNAHVRLGEKNLVVRAGLENLPKLISVLGGAFYFTVLLAAFMDLFFLALFLTLPLFLKVVKVMSNEEDDIRFWRAIPQMLKTALFNQLLIILISIAQSVWTFA